MNPLTACPRAATTRLLLFVLCGLLLCHARGGAQQGGADPVDRPGAKPVVAEAGDAPVEEGKAEPNKEELQKQYDAVYAELQQLSKEYQQTKDPETLKKLQEKSAEYQALRKKLGLDAQAAQAAKPKRSKTELQPVIDKAIEKGVEFLRKQQQDDGSVPVGYEKPANQQNVMTAYYDHYAPGSTALAVMAMVKSGVDLKDEFFVKALTYLSKYDPKECNESYTPALLCLSVHAFIHKWHELEALPRKHPKKLGKMKGETEKILDLVMRRGCARLLEIYYSTGWAGFTYGGTFALGDARTPVTGGAAAVPPMPEKTTKLVDYSNTQFGVLGLLAAQLYGINVPDAVWIKLLEEHLLAQQKDGPEAKLDFVSFGKLFPRNQGTSARDKAKARGWGYMSATRVEEFNKDKNGGFAGTQTPTVSMSWAGLGSVAAIRGVLLERKKLPETLDASSLEALYDGVAYLQNKVTSSVGEVGRDYYTLYSMEKSASLSGLEALGGTEWYWYGADIVCGKQQGDGSWDGGSMRNISTCFVLLFLNRGTQSLAPAITMVGE